MSMERQTQTLTLPSGITAVVLTKWLFEEYLQIETANVKVAKNLKISAGGELPAAEIDADAMLASTRLTMRLGIRKLTAADGSDIPVTDETIGALDMEDGLALREAVNAIQAGSKKK